MCTIINSYCVCVFMACEFQKVIYTCIHRITVLTRSFSEGLSLHIWVTHLNFLPWEVCKVEGHL